MFLQAALETSDVLLCGRALDAMAGAGARVTGAGIPQQLNLLSLVLSNALNNRASTPGAVQVC